MDSETLQKLMNERQFILRAQHPLPWEVQAIQLKLSYDILRKEIVGAGERTLKTQLKKTTGNKTLQGDEARDFWVANLIPVALLILGMSFETLLKGLQIATGSSEILDESNSKLINLVGDHNLVDMAGRCKFKLSSTEKAHLKLLSNFIRWQGRYPLPNELSEFSRNAEGITLFEKSAETVDDLFVRIQDEIEKRKSQVSSVPSE